jgi:hypothetical protein
VTFLPGEEVSRVINDLSQRPFQFSTAIAVVTMIELLVAKSVFTRRGFD